MLAEARWVRQRAIDGWARQWPARRAHSVAFGWQGFSHQHRRESL